jgi:hypothetical protein
MVSLSRSKAVLELGKRLTAPLDDDGNLVAAMMFGPRFVVSVTKLRKGECPCSPAPTVTPTAQ